TAKKVPLLGDLKPSGKYVMEDLHKVGGVPAVMKYLLEKGMLDGSCVTVTGRSIAENLESAKPLAAGQTVIAPLEKPLKKIGHVCPEAQEGGPIALVKHGDRISIDDEKHSITVHVSAAELNRRRKKWKQPKYKVTRGTLAKYIQLVKPASEGCVTDEPIARR